MFTQDLHQWKVSFLSCLIRHIETSAAEKKKKRNGSSSLEEAYQNRKAGMESADEGLNCVSTDVLTVSLSPSSGMDGSHRIPERIR